MIRTPWRSAALVLVCVMISALSFATPNIVSISPQSGMVGSYVTISGSGFGTTQDTSLLSLGTVSATAVSWSDTSIVAVVPAGAPSGSFSLTVSGQTATSGVYAITLIPTNWSDVDIGAVGVSPEAQPMPAEYSPSTGQERVSGPQQTCCTLPISRSRVMDRLSPA